jgi:hypothetical protein
MRVRATPNFEIDTEELKGKAEVFLKDSTAVIKVCSKIDCDHACQWCAGVLGRSGEVAGRMQPRGGWRHPRRR